MSATLPITTNDRSVIRTATVAGQVDFTFDFPVQSATDLVVAAALAATPSVFVPLSYAAGDFAVAGVGDAAGGTVTLASGLAIGDRVEIKGLSIVSRTMSIIRGGKFRSEAMDADLDRLTMIAQELRRDVDGAVSRALDLAVQIEACADALGLSVGDFGLANWRMRRALTHLGVYWTIDATIPADPSSALAIAWNGPMPRGGILWAHIAATLAWDDAEMAAFLVVALSMDP